jgi:cytochrome P450
VATVRGPSFVLGWLLRYTHDPYGVFAKLLGRYGDPTRFRLAGTPGTVVTGCPEGVRAIIGADHHTLAPWRPPSLALLTEDSLFLQSGERHQATRRMLAPLFAAPRQAEHGAMMARVVDERLARIEPGVVNANDLALDLTLRIILAAIFGDREVDRDEARIERFRAAACRVLDDGGPIALYLPLVQRLSPRWKRITRAVAELRALVRDEIAARRRTEMGTGAGTGATDMLSQLLRVRTPDGAPLAVREIAVHLADLVIAGHETTTVAVAWTCYELCRHPAVLARLVDELDAHRARGGSPPALPYLQAVCLESLRVHPPLVLLTREVTRPLSVCGHAVPPGQGVSIAVPVAHTNPDVWAEPHAFRPERFLARAPRPEHYLPFGGGGQRCLGATFALQELAFILAGLLARFRVRLHRDRPVRARPRVITIAAKGGVLLHLERRAAPVPAT